MNKFTLKKRIKNQIFFDRNIPISRGSGNGKGVELMVENNVSAVQQ